MNLINDIRHTLANARRAWDRRPSAVTRADRYRQFAQSGYEHGFHAGSTVRRRNMEWYPSSDGSANTGNYYPSAELGRNRNDWITRVVTSTNLMRTAFRTLCARSEFAYRNSPYAKRAVSLLKTFVVGKGIIPFPAVRLPNGEPDENTNNQLKEGWKRFNDQAMRLGSQHVTVMEAQGIEFEMMAQLGSVIRERKESRSGSWLPLAYNLVKPYRLNFAKDNYYDDLYYRSIIGGNASDRIEKTGLTVLGQVFNGHMEPIGFHILGENDPVPSNLINPFGMSIHYRQREAEQYLGFPWMIASLGKDFDIQELLDDTMDQARALARMGIYIDKQDKISFLMDQSYVNDDASNGPPSVALEKGSMFAGEKKPEPIMFESKLSGSIDDLIKLELAGMAVGLDISYQLLTSDLLGASFSGSRTNSITDSKVMSGVFGSFVNSNCQPTWNDFIEFSFLSGKVAGVTYSEYQKDKWRFLQCYHMPEETDWFDPHEKVKAQRLRLQTGIITLQELCEEEGRDYKAVLQQRATEKEFIKSLGLEEILCTYNAATTFAQQQETDPKSAQPDPGNDNPTGGNKNGK